MVSYIGMLSPGTFA